jgi:hypothetical protein
LANFSHARLESLPSTMRQHKLLTLFFLLGANIAFGHQDFWVVKDFGNVKVRIKTGFQYEEIKKSWIIGELAYKLCLQLNFTKPVFIDFNHHYVDNCEPGYFLSFDDGSIVQTWETGKSKPFLKEKSLVIREVGRQFTPSITLKLLEYAVANVDKIKNTQKTIEYNQNYCQWKIKTVDTLQVKRIVAQNASDVVNKILSTQIFRQEDQEIKGGISYYFQRDKYHIFYRDYDTKDSVLLSVDNIYQFQNMPIRECIVFDTDSSFYYLKGANNFHTSTRKVIEKIYDNYRPFEIGTVGSYKVTFSFWYYDGTEGTQPKERNVLYKSDTGEIVQDLDKKIGEK